MTLPAPDPQAAAHSARLAAHIAQAIAAAGGWLPFARYMELALYAPGLGYYSGGAQKFGPAGDFVTAPELTPLFARSLARTVAPLMAASAPRIIEAGAGSGVLAADLLAELARFDGLPERYAILDLSGELRLRQAETLQARVPELAGRVDWLDRMPEAFSGVVIGNEVLDAMPVHLVSWQADGMRERGVMVEDGRFAWSERPAGGALLQAAQRLPVRPPYQSEINLAARAWVRQWGSILDRGALLLIDYGFPAVEYYHPQRDQGTLMCHYRHHAHGDPFHIPGLTDITAHVDFTAVAEAGLEGGLSLLGYTSQAQFLLASGLLELLAETGPTDQVAYLRAASAVQKLTSPAEMGELFKVMALGRGVALPLAGFARGDRSHTL